MRLEKWFRELDDSATMKERLQQDSDEVQTTELEEDTKWDTAFAASCDVLAKLAAEALEDHRAGRTLPLDPEML